MKKYNDIGDLYKDRFSDYAPEPPASVWKNIQSAAHKKTSLWKKIVFSIAGAVIVGAIAYLIAVNPKSDESITTIAKTNQKNTGNNEISNRELTSENIPVISDEENVVGLQQKDHQPSPGTQNKEHTSLPVDHSSDDNSIERTARDVVELPAPSNKKVVIPVTTDVSAKQTQEQNPSKIIQTEGQPKRRLPIRISKDTSICENTEAQLYVYNVENIRWSTGETQNRITVYPSFGEQYSVTFTTGNGKDSTVYINVKVVQCTNVHIPNAFTPNGDGLNDIFLARTNMELKSFEMIIYAANRKQVLFISKDIDRGWDGTYNGQTQPHGLYFYMIRYTDNFGKLVEKPGELLLILQ